MIDLGTMEKTSKEWKQEADKWHEVIDGFQVRNETEAALAAEAMSEMKQRLDTLEATRTSVTKPLLEAKRKVDAWFKPAATSLKMGLDLLRGRVGEFTAAQRQEAARLLTEASKSSPVEAAALVAESNRAQAAAPSVREVWRFEVEDPSQLPPQFLVPDEKAIGAVVRSQKGKTKIPGVRVFVEHRAVVK